jgi:hypothetical protein
MVHHTLAARAKQAGTKQLLGVGLTLVGFIVLAAPQQAAIASPQQHFPVAQLHTNQSSQNQLPRSVVRQVRHDLSQRLNIPQRDLDVVSFEQQTWVYRTDMTAQVIKLEANQNTDLLPEVSDRLLQTIAEEFDVSVNSLRITEAQPKVWDGCMGIYVPNQACTMIAISGWQAIVAGENQSWVYHLSEDGSRIVLNPTASGGSLTPSFIPTDGQPSESIDNTIIFRAVTSGGLAGTVSQVILTADGTIYRQVSQPTSPRPSDPVVERRLSPEQVQQFQQLLEEQRFPNLNGLRYITDAAFADYPTITFYAMGGQVEYIDLAYDDLPEALQEVIQAWNQF